MGKLSVSVGETRQIRQYEPMKYDLTYEMDLGDNVSQAEVKKIANNVREHLQGIMNEWFEEDLKRKSPR